MTDILTQIGTGIKDFLAGLVDPLQVATDDMKDFETLQKKRAKFNGRKMVLQAALNDIFGVTSSPWIIVEWNTGIGQNTYTFEESEETPIMFFEPSEVEVVYIFEPSELDDEDYDFKILIPSSIHSAELERRVRAETILYKLAGPRFIIETY